MRRSEVNERIREAEAFLQRFLFLLPPWAHWDPEQWRRESTRTRQVREHYLGWDLTDFGQGNFLRQGLVLFTLRNGSPAVPEGKTYTEKVIMLRDGQVNPFHFHWNKMEDIINRGGGTLVMELMPADRETEEASRESFTVYIDGVARRCEAGERIELAPGESITLYPYLYHKFQAEGSDVLVGEVSKVNDDKRDNRYLKPLGRFPTILEDEPPYRLLVSDYDDPRFGLTEG
ncbi:MAG: D-lyxose/D-mannose family sugar isomerase [Spirochaetaceae bacterium]|nr:MAG: D-lyxose/D-mannose family sugar isomerase [Spirochaetaceae bacterium]